MQLGLGENTWWGSSFDRVEAVALTEKLGFDAYGIFTQDLTPSLKRRMRDALRDADLPVTSALAVATSVCDWNVEVRRFTVGWLDEQLDVCYDFGSRTMILVLGEYLWEKAEVRPEVQYGWTIESLREVCDHAGSLGIDVAVETSVSTYSLVRTIGDTAKLIGDVNHPSIKANVDVVNMHILGDGPGALETLRGKIANVHFSDTPKGAYLHYPPGEGDLPLSEDLAALKSAGFEQTVEVELEGLPSHSQIADWVRRAYVATADMMERLGVTRDADRP